MTSTASRASRPYHGPVVCLTLPEAERVAFALQNRDDDEAKAITSKIAVALTSHPAFRTPAK